MTNASDRGPLAGLLAGVLLGLCVLAVAIAVPVSISLGTQTAAAARPQALRKADVYLSILTGDMTGSKLGPAYVPADFTVPADATVTVHIVDFDDATPQKPASYARVQGTAGDVETVQAIAGNDPNAPGKGAVVSALNPQTEVGHTFTVPALHLNVPVAAKAITTFTFKTGAPGTYHWQCYNPCGSGPAGWNGAMQTARYMQGTLTVA